MRPRRSSSDGPRRFISIVMVSDFRYNACVRLDLFLKTSRLVKRRTLAQELCESGRVLLNGHAAKPAKEVRAGDRITLRFPSKTIELEVTAVPSSSKRPAQEPPIRVISETRVLREENE
jgi:ribosomal 50S subunit-recycling heat shock protein